jgi:hypothetical protein
MTVSLRVSSLFCLLFLVFAAQAQVAHDSALIAAQVKPLRSASSLGVPGTAVADPAVVDSALTALNEPAPVVAPVLVTLTGKVLTEQQKPLAGAIVFIKETAAIVSTDAKGEYSLQAPRGVNTLIISYAGYEEQRLTTSDFLPATVYLLPTAKKKGLR